MTSNEIQQYVYDFLHDKGLPHKSIVAVMGNISAESDWSPNLIEVGSGVGFGLCQWSYTRRTQLEAYGTDLQHQCEFLWSELTGANTATTGADLQWINPPASSVTGGISFSCTLTQFKSADGTVEFLTTAFCYCWERPAPETNHLESRRIPSAETFDTTMTYHGNNPNPDPDPDPDPNPDPDPVFGDDYFTVYEEYFEKYDDLSEVYKKILTTPYIMKQLSADFILFLRTLNFDDPVHMKFTFNHNKQQIGKNFLGNKLTFDNKEYTIKDVRSNGYLVLTYGGSVCDNYINPCYIYQTEEEKEITKNNNIEKIKAHIAEEKAEQTEV